MSTADPRAPAWAQAARQCCRRLAALHGPTEAALLAMGERLRLAHSTSQNLTVMANALAGRLNEPEFQETLNGLDGAVHLVHDLRGYKSSRSDRLRGIVDTAKAIRSGLNGLLQTMTHVNVLGVNAKIEAAQMTASGVDFTLFTHEIVRLSARGRRNIEEVGQELTALLGAAGQALDLQHAFDQTHLRELTEVSQRLETSLSAMRRRQVEAVAALERLPKVLELATQRIGGVVAGLQFGDISRQRLEHVETALGMLADVAEGTQPLPHEDEQELPVFVALVCELQGRQLGQIEQEFAHNVGVALDNLRELVVAIGDIKGQTEAVYSDGMDGGSTFLMAIDQELEKVSAAVDHYAQATTRTEDSLRGVTGAADRMAEAMKAIAEVDADMNLIGLNASIKCGNLGTKGRALNVVAQELRAFARQTRGHATAMEQRLGQVTAVAVEVSGAGDGGRWDSLHEIKRDLDHSVEQLRQSGGETAWVLSQIQEQSAAVMAAVEQAVASFDAHHAYRAAIAATLKELERLTAQATAGLSPQDLERGRGRMLRFMEDHYTMDTERHVHGNISAPSAAAADLDDILF